MSEIVSDTIVEKLKKILALTTSPSPGEAAAAMGHLHRLLEKHNLEMADLESSGAEAGSVGKSSSFDVGGSLWHRDLLQDVASACYCRVILHKTRRGWKNASLVGRKENVETTKMLFTWLVRQINEMGLAAHKEYYRVTPKHMHRDIPGRVWKTDWRAGCLQTLNRRLYEMSKKQDVASTALVVCRKKENQDFISKNMGPLRNVGGQRTVRFSKQFVDGAQAGRSINLQPFINGGGRKEELD